MKRRSFIRNLILSLAAAPVLARMAPKIMVEQEAVRGLLVETHPKIMVRNYLADCIIMAGNRTGKRIIDMPFGPSVFPHGLGNCIRSSTP